jgi:tetratricopeptide (TPR) repeat protein
MQAVQQHAGQGQQAPQEPIRRRISNFLAHAVSRFRIALLVILIAAAAFLVGYIVYNEVSKKLLADSTFLAETAQAKYDSWRSEADVQKKAALEKDLFDTLGTLINRYPRQYGGQRGLFTRAEASFAKKSWDDSLKDYETLAARFPKSYLAPISLFDAAVCYEEKGDTDTALKLYVKAAGTYKDSTVAPRALFDSGRLYEAKSDWTSAQKSYEAMDGLYAQSMWTRLAKNRIVELKVLGKIK